MATLAPDKLAELVRRKDELTLDQQHRLAAILRQQARGFRSNRYIEHIFNKLGHGLHPKQVAFASLNVLEAFFGGAVAGGKSQALLIAALQYVDIPGYAAIIFRRTFTDLSLEGALMDRTEKYLSDTDARWSALDKRWEFPGGGSLTFAYLEHENQKFRYGSAEFQYIAFDELAEHPEANYTFLFSRLRKKSTLPVPLRMRAASNPIGPYTEWVRRRFVPDDYIQADVHEKFSNIWTVDTPCEECESTGRLQVDPAVGIHEEQECFYCDGEGARRRWFVPSKMDDNPTVDAKDYRKSTVNLNPLDRAKLESGRWDVVDEGGIFRAAWFRYFDRQGEHIRLYNGPDDPVRLKLCPQERIGRFLTADTASKTKTQNDYTVICSWAYDVLTYDLMLLGVIREKMEVPSILPTILAAYRSLNAEFVIIEDAASGIGVIQDARGNRGHGMNVRAFSPGDRDKVSRATPAAIRMEAGKVYWPTGEPKWLTPFIEEVLAFNGEQEGHDDCVDNLSMAAWHVSTLDLVTKNGGGAKPGVASMGPLDRHVEGQRFGANEGAFSTVGVSGPPGFRPFGENW
ncbi:MAG: phage terminase large subunit [Planctomycetaceae bacterium]|nr:phage terminase large subunit [Planctomycetaceae bacterium]